MFAHANAEIIRTTADSGNLVANFGSYQVYQDDDVQMTLSAGLYTDTDAVGDAVVTEGQYHARPTPYSAGTGITHDYDNEHTIDSWYPEVAILTFDSVVELAGVWLSYIDPCDTFDLFADTNNDGVLERIAKDLALPDNSIAFVDLSAYNLVGSLFGVGASPHAPCQTSFSFSRTSSCDKTTTQSGWKLKKVVFDDVEEVPLPAAFPLFMAGLAGFGFASTRRKQA